MFISFEEVKKLATLEQVATWLKLDTRNNRVQCPINQGDKRELALNHPKNLFYCFGCKVGGDQIQLVAHVHNVPQKHAALAIQKHFHGYVPKAAEAKLPLEGLSYLEFEHELVQALGLTVEQASALGIGFARKGTLAGRLLLPIRDTQGRLLGYAGFCDDKEPRLKLGRLEAPG